MVYTLERFKDELSLVQQNPNFADAQLQRFFEHTLNYVHAENDRIKHLHTQIMQMRSERSAELTAHSATRCDLMRSLSEERTAHSDTRCALIKSQSNVETAEIMHDLLRWRILSQKGLLDRAREELAEQTHVAAQPKPASTVFLGKIPCKKVLVVGTSAFVVNEIVVEMGGPDVLEIMYVKPAVRKFSHVGKKALQASWGGVKNVATLPVDIPVYLVIRPFKRRFLKTESASTQQVQAPKQPLVPTNLHPHGETKDTPQKENAAVLLPPKPEATSAIISVPTEPLPVPPANGML